MHSRYKKFNLFIYLLRLETGKIWSMSYLYNIIHYIKNEKNQNILKCKHSTKNSD